MIVQQQDCFSRRSTKKAEYIAEKYSWKQRDVCSRTSAKMGLSPHQEVEKYINSIPSIKFLDLPDGQGTIHKDMNLRLDMQGMSSHNPPRHNLQVQVNRECVITSLKRVKGDTVAGPVFVPQGNIWSASQIRSMLIETMDVSSNTDPGEQKSKSAVDKYLMDLEKKKRREEKRKKQ